MTSARRSVAPESESARHRFAGPNNGTPVFGAFVVLLLVIAPALFASERVTAESVGLAALMLLGIMSPMLVWIVCRMQDVVTCDSDTRTLRVRRRRAFVPDAVYDYTGADVSSVSITRLSEGDDVYYGRVRMADQRQFRFTVEHADADVVAHAARALLAAVGRVDDLPILYYPSPLLTEQPIPFAEASIARPSASS